MELVKPSEKYLDSYYRGCLETWENVHDRYIIHNPYEYEEWKNHIFTDYENQAAGINLPSGFVPSITYWLVDNGEYLGTVNIRPKLSETLKEYGGNVGVVLKPSSRGNGMGMLFSKLIIDKIRELKISPIMLTCEESNKKSWLLMEHLNYTKKELYTTFINGKKVKARRYWYD